MAQPPMTCVDTRSPAQVEDDRLQLAYYMRDELMQQHDLSEADATACAQTCAEALARLKGNELAEGLSAFRQQARRRRDAAIRAELRTGNAAELARRYDLSVTQIYDIAARRAG